MSDVASRTAESFTVVVCSFNHESYIEECLESVGAQSDQDFQLIVTDDGSKDRSPHIIREWLSVNRPDSTFIAHPTNRGLCPTLNEALGAATGTLLAMVAGDDRWSPERIASHRAAMFAAPTSVAIAYSDARVVDEGGHVIRESFLDEWVRERPSGDIFPRLVRGNFVPAMATTFRTALVRSVGGWDPGLSFEDWDMLLRLSRSYTTVFVDGFLADYRRHATAMSIDAMNNPDMLASSVDLLMKHRGHSEETDRALAYIVGIHVDQLRDLRDARAASAVRQLARLSPTRRNVLRAVGASTGVPLATVDRWLSTAGRLTR